MDANKLKVLQDIGFRIPQVCGLCRHGVFLNDDWGGCTLHSYTHLKHERKHDLSIHRFGSCPQFERDQGRSAALGAFENFSL